MAAETSSTVASGGLGMIWDFFSLSSLELLELLQGAVLCRGLGSASMGASLLASAPMDIDSNTRTLRGLLISSIVLRLDE